MENDMQDREEDSEVFWNEFQKVLFNSFGEFSSWKDLDTVSWIVLLFAIYQITLVMMNLVIGIISEKLCELLDNRI
jgi:hypothetical protein